MQDEGESRDLGRHGVPLRAVVAIPVRNEAKRIGACLRALAAQDGVSPRGIGIVLFLNNCWDGTAREVEAARDGMSCAIRVIVRDRVNGHAGWARRAAMDAAAEWLEAEGVTQGALRGAILTTDADSRVPRDWVARNLAALERGVDAVAGRITLDSDEAARLPARLHARGRLEARYEALLMELTARLDPQPHDPWPNHWTASGASLAVTLDAYRRVGGLPAVPVGEDRAFIQQLRAHGARVRCDPDIAVVTSGRLRGRAAGGAADTIRRRCADPDSPCDDRLEPVLRAAIRPLWRRLAKHGATFTFKPLRPRDLPKEIRRAHVALSLLRAASRLRAGLATSLARVRGRGRPDVALTVSVQSRIVPALGPSVPGSGAESSATAGP